VKRTSVVAVTMGGLLFGVALVGFLFFSFSPATLRIAVGPPGSDDVKVIQSITQAFTRERHYVRLRPILTEGAAESAAELGAGKADLAVVRADLNLPEEAQSVAVFRKNLVIMWVTNAPGQKATKPIKTIQDLAGHRIGVIGKMEANVQLLKTILSESGVVHEKVEIMQFGTTDITNALRNQKVDAMMAVGPVDSRITSEAISATTRKGTVPTFLDISAAEIIARKHPVYESTQIAAGALGANPQSPDDDITTLGVNHLIVARKAVSATTITAFTKQLFAIRHALQSEFPDVTKIEVPDTDKAAPIPAHAGAAAYIDGTERTFLERYSDFMWLGIMLLSGLASAGAALRSYFKRGERAHNTALRNRLVDMIATVRDSVSIEELDRMQKEADTILRNTLSCFENGAVEEDTLSAFTIALEQFHDAVADRKAWIANNPYSPRRSSKPAAVNVGAEAPS
jgi:TRAP transporter TAXI family solute receptor